MPSSSHRIALRAATLRGLWTLLLVCATFGPSAQEANAVNDIIPFQTTTKTLPNGLEVIVMPMPSSGLVAFWSIVRTGSRDEYEPGRSGFAHFFEHMMFRGTERYPPQRYLETTTRIGADANAYTTDDHTAFHLSLSKEDLEKVLEIESDRFQNLSYSEPAFQTETGAVYGEYRKSRTDPEFALEESLMATAFEKHTYGHTTMGFERDIAAMPKMYDYSRSFFARYYRPENTVLFVSGDVTPDAVLPLIDKYYGGWKRGYVAPQIPAEPEQREERRVDVKFDGQTLPVVIVGYKLPAFAPADRTRVAADLLTDLSFGETSATYRRLVLEEQVVEEIDAYAPDHRDPNLLTISARVKDPAKVDYVLGVIDETVAAALASPPDAARLAQYIALTGDLDGVRTLYATYAVVTPEDVQRAAQTYFVAAHRTVGVLRSRQ